MCCLYINRDVRNLDISELLGIRVDQIAFPIKQVSERLRRLSASGVVMTQQDTGRRGRDKRSEADVAPFMTAGA